MKRCYVASPYGFAEGTRYWYEHVLLPTLSGHVEVLDPWAVQLPVRADGCDDREFWTSVGRHHYATITDSAQLMVALLDQEPPDVGTVCEVSWAAAHHIPVIAYRNDLRSSGEPGLSFNLMIYAAIELSGGTLVRSLAELQEALAQYT